MYFVKIFFIFLDKHHSRKAYSQWAVKRSYEAFERKERTWPGGQGKERGDDSKKCWGISLRKVKQGWPFAPGRCNKVGGYGDRTKQAKTELEGEYER